MLMSPNNTIQPAQFVPNYVTGILYMNKADHTTFFGTNLEYIQGIHMIPLTAISPFIRQPSFVATEWEAKLSAIIGNVDSGWKGILMANLAISDAQTAWTFFTVGFQGAAWLDDGASLTWYLAFVAGLLAGGNPLPPLQAPTPTPATSAPPTTSVPPVTPAPTTPAPTTPAPATTPTPAPATASAWNPTQFYQVGATVSYDDIIMSVRSLTRPKQLGLQPRLSRCGGKFREDSRSYSHSFQIYIAR
jgi:endo-1,3(4)-beta-glucanase